jgi:hypothetical protein
VSDSPRFWCLTPRDSGVWNPESPGDNRAIKLSFRRAFLDLVAVGWVGIDVSVCYYPGEHIQHKKSLGSPPILNGSSPCSVRTSSAESVYLMSFISRLNGASHEGYDDRALAFGNGKAIVLRTTLTAPVNDSEGSLTPRAALVVRRGALAFSTYVLTLPK